MNIEDIRLGYALSSSSLPKGYMGAILITDYKGFPIEFQYTDPIAPTKIQQVLYGEGLEKYIKVDVVLDSLLNVLSNKIDILFVQDEDLLRYNCENLSIVRVSATKSTPIGEQGEFSRVKGNEYLVQASSSNSPVRIQTKAELSPESEQFQKILEILKESGNFIDITEPINRVYKAIDLICAQEV